MEQVTRDNHFVPQAYLRRWSHRGTEVWTYRLLVSHAKVPEWVSLPVKGVAFRRDLYTSVVGGTEVDDFESWVEGDFESPGLAAIQRVVDESTLRRNDWNALARYPRTSAVHR